MVRLEETTFVQAPVERCFDLARSVEVHLAGNVHFGESALATGGVTTRLLDRGPEVTVAGQAFLFLARIGEQDYGFRTAQLFPGGDDPRHLPVHAAQTLLSSRAERCRIATSCGR
jgi:hypothetical protein